MSPCDPELETVASFDPVEWANYLFEASLESDASSKPKAYSVRSLLEWEAVAMLGVTFWGTPSVSNRWCRGPSARRHIFKIPLVVGLANPLMGWCHRLGPPYLVDDVWFCVHKYLKTKLLVIV